MTFTRALSTNNYGPAKFIVDGTTVANGTHSTIAAALTSASSGDTVFIRPGTYVENLTLKAGVNLTAYSCDSSLNATAHVIISGTCTLTTAGSVTISGIQLQTNSAAILAVTGTLASIVNLNNCYLNCTNATGITFSSSSASAVINIYNCNGDIGTTGISLFTHSSAGVLRINNSGIGNTGNSTTASTCSAGFISFNYSIIAFPISYSSPSVSAGFVMNQFYGSATNTTSLTTSGTGTVTCVKNFFATGTASAISVGAGTTVSLLENVIDSSNTNVVTGAGTVVYTSNDFPNSSSTINTTTQTARYVVNGIERSTKQPAFLAYLASTASNKTGNATVYTLGTDALTEVFDQNGDFNTNGTFTAPLTGRYLLSAGVFFTGCTIAQIFRVQIVTTARTYVAQQAHPAYSGDQCPTLTVVADMTAGNTATVACTVFGEAGDTVDISGSANASTFFSGYLIC